MNTAPFRDLCNIPDSGNDKKWDFVAMGSNCVPIPGAMGVADYIMIDGFKQLVGKNAANMELLCRGMTFYGSVITSAVIILIGYIIRKKRAK